MAPFAGLKRKSKKGQPTTRTPSPPILQPTRETAHVPHMYMRAAVENAEDSQARGSSTKKRKHVEESSADSSPPSSPHPKAKSKPVAFNKRVIASYEALDHKAQEATRITLGFQRLYEAARFLPRLVGQYANYDSILTQGLVREFAYKDPEAKAGLQAMHEEQLEIMHYNSFWESFVCYPIIKDFFPGFSEHTAYLRRKPDLVCQMATFMRSVANKARSDDACRLKDPDHILRLCSSLTTTEREEVHAKMRRGFNHPATGRLLCPIRLLGDFDQDPEVFCREVRARRKGGLKILSTDWPLLLYDYDLYLEGHDPEDPDDCLPGFMRSQILLDSYRATFTGMSTTSIADSTPSGKTKGKPSISRSYDHREVTLHSICYIAALVRFALNAQLEWDDNDMDFYGRKFFNAIQTLFMRNEEFTNDLLAWWNEQIYGESTSDPEEAPDTDTAFTRMLARDDARRKAAAAQAARASGSAVPEGEGSDADADADGEADA